MSLKDWVAEDKVLIQIANEKDIENLFKLVKRDIKDASIEELSVDRRFATAYNAALQLSTIVIHASGYRVKSAAGHHWITISLLPEVMGTSQKSRSNYFNACRNKRNITDYDRSGLISNQDLKELLKEVKAFESDVINWIKKYHPTLDSIAT